MQASVLTLDHFNDPAGGQAVQILNGSVGSSAGSLTTGIAAPGGSREIYTEIESILPGGSEVNLKVNTFTTADNLQLENSVNVESFAKVTWDANGAGLNANLTAFAGLGLYDVVIDKDTTFAITITTWGTGSATASVTKAADFIGDINLLWADFAGVADVSNIDEIVVNINPDRGGDVAVHSLVAVPEPNAGLAVAGLLGLGLLLRRTRK